jgi:hypothetical protein
VKEITSDQTSFPDYNLANSMGGIILQPKRDKIIVTREVCNFSEFLNDFGAWAQAMIFIATALIPLFRISTIEGFLIHRLYKTIAQ